MKSRTWKALLRFWAADRGLSIFLGLLILIIFVLPAFATPGLLSRLAGDVAFSLLLVAGAVAMPEYRWMRFVVPPMVALALVVRWASIARLQRIRGMARDFLARHPAAVRYHRGITSLPPRPVTRERIQGSVAVYLLLGLTWASAYELLHILRPEAWTGAASEAPISQTWIYYSFVTLTTMGYGDITPVHPVARSLAILEAVTGQLYLAITLARLVALHIKSGEKG
jgi:hypothetical protein